MLKNNIFLFFVFVLFVSSCDTHTADIQNTEEDGGGSQDGGGSRGLPGGEPPLGKVDTREAPGAPTGLQLTQANDNIVALWTAPTNKGKNDDGSIPSSVSYLITIPKKENQNNRFETEDTTYTISSNIIALFQLNDKTITIKVVAKNEIGESEKAVGTILYHKSRPPGAVTLILIDKGQNGKVNISWTAPADKGYDKDGSIPKVIKYKAILTYSTLRIPRIIPSSNPWIYPVEEVGLSNVEVSASNEAGEGPTLKVRYYSN